MTLHGWVRSRKTSWTESFGLAVRFSVGQYLPKSHFERSQPRLDGLPAGDMCPFFQDQCCKLWKMFPQLQSSTGRRLQAYALIERQMHWPSFKIHVVHEDKPVTVLKVGVSINLVFPRVTQNASLSIEDRLLFLCRNITPGQKGDVLVIKRG